MKYVIAYSGGKDCTLTIERLNLEGHILKGIIVLKSKDNISFNHALTYEISKQYADALGVTLYLVECESIFDPKAILNSMLQMKKNGIDAVAYGETSFYYKEMKQMSQSVGLKLLAPLYRLEGENLMNEIMQKNYKLLIVNASKKIPFAKDIIGKYIDESMLDKLKKAGMDVTGNDGSYHSQVIDCSLFSHPIKLPKPRIVELATLYLAVFDEGD